MEFDSMLILEQKKNRRVLPGGLLITLGLKLPPSPSYMLEKKKKKKNWVMRQFANSSLIMLVKKHSDGKISVAYSSDAFSFSLFLCSTSI